MNAVYAVTACPLSSLSARIRATAMPIAGLIVLIAVDLGLAMLTGLAGAFVGIALWGIHMAVTQEQFAKLRADRSPVGSRGSVSGIFNLFTGLTPLAASVVIGVIWDASRSSATFLVSADCAGLALASLARRSAGKGGTASWKRLSAKAETQDD